MAEEKRASTVRQRVRAWAVHAFSAAGAVLALLALTAIDAHRWTEAMLWLFAALVVDGIDGTLARAANVKAHAPRIDGDALDLVVDYLNYVLVPTIFILEARLLPDGLALPLAALVQLSSVYVFARRDMKTADHYFRGFPALWNIVALYLFAARIDPAIAAAVVAGLVALTFAPIHFVHPFRVREYQPWTALLAMVWAATTLALLIPGAAEPVRNSMLTASATASVLLVTIGLMRSVRGPRPSDDRQQPVGR